MKPTESEPKRLPGDAGVAAPVVAASMPVRQLQDLPKDELEILAEEIGLEAARYKTRQHLVAAVHERRQMIGAMDREAMLDVIKWARRPIPLNVSREHLAVEIVRIPSMRFQGLSHRGLIVLAQLRGLPVAAGEPVPSIVRKLKKQEGFFSRLNRKRRAMLGSIVSNMIGDSEAEVDYRFLPPQNGGAAADENARSASIKHEIEDAGLFGGIAGRIKKSADGYVNQKLDEIEARIDRKLDEIDRRLAEWRDKEIANRIRILKITLWASVIVSLVSLVYFYVKVYVLY